jgi:hypothetical protein
MKARVPSTVMEDVLGNPGQMGGRLVNVQKMAVLGLSTSPVSGTVFVDGVSCGVGSPGLEIQVPVPAGAHQVSFGLFAGYAAPSNQYLSLRAGEVRHVVGIYVATVPPTGGLNMTTTPVSGGIFVDGDEVGAGSVSMTIQTGRFRNSLNIDPGSHVVSFEAVSGYTTPAPQTVNVTVGTTLNVVGTYVATVVPPPPPVVIAKSYLQVTTTPWAGGIVIDGVSRGNAPVTLEVAAGSHTVSFGAITGGYTTPAAQTVNVVAGQTVDVLGIYTAIVVTPTPTPTPTFALSVAGWIWEWVVTDFTPHPGTYGYWRKRAVSGLSCTITKNGVLVQTVSLPSTLSLAAGTYLITARPYTGSGTQWFDPWGNKRIYSGTFTPPAPVTVTLPGTVELVWSQPQKPYYPPPLDSSGHPAIGAAVGWQAV